MEPGGRHTRRNQQIQPGHELMERLADRSRMDAAAFCEGKQRSGGLTLLTVTLFYVTSQTRSQPGPERHHSTLAELGFTDEQGVLSEVHFSQLQFGHLAGTQPQA